VIKVPRLKANRHGVFCVRVYWRDDAGRLRESLHSLGTKSATVARILALQFNEAYERQRAMTSKPTLPNLDDLVNKYKLDIGRGIMEASDPDDHALMMKAIEAYKAIHGAYPPLQEAMNVGRTPAPRIVAKSMPFSQVMAAYLEEKKRDNAPQTIVEKGRTYKDFSDIFGDLDLNLYTKGEMVQWKTADLKRGLGTNRINKRLGQMNDLFKWSIAHGHYTAHPTSPVDGLFISSKGKLGAQVEHYEPFSNDELAAIFSSTYPEEMPKPDHYWLPIVALFTGARREEIASLKASNVKKVDGVSCFLIEGGKTADARRVVPVHPQLEALGFMAYAQHLQSMGQELLFPYLVDGANGRGKNAGRQFAKLLDKRKIQDERKVFHSFRHTLITRLHATGANPAHVMQITGHRGETAQSVHFQTYTHDVGLKALDDTLRKLEYSFDLDAIKIEDPKFDGFLKRWNTQNLRKHRLNKS
jgi:integrase